MSDTLDRLKALSDKLEVKLAGKTASSPTKEVKPIAIAVVKPVKKIQDVEKEHSNTVSTHTKLAERIITLMSIDKNTEKVRAQNIHKVARLYQKLNIQEKAPDFDQIFIYKAMNISGIGLKEDDFGEIREGKYCQIIAITYEPDKNGKKKAKNISLSYFGKAEKLAERLKNDIMEFVLRWRYEKAFQNLEHYRYLLDKIKPSDKLF
ncbi:MAG: hypothetical protein HF962_02745 [Sulfurovum sp.]|nr:hypothetical protein [Sulfurovum sp.]